MVRMVQSMAQQARWSRRRFSCQRSQFLYVSVRSFHCLLRAPAVRMSNCALRVALRASCSVALRPDWPWATPDFRTASLYSFVLWCVVSALARRSNQYNTLSMASGTASRSCADSCLPRCSVANDGSRVSSRKAFGYQVLDRLTQDLSSGA